MDVGDPIMNPMTIPWEAIGKIVPVTTFVLVIVIGYLMRQNGQLVSVAFKSHESLEGLKAIVKIMSSEITSLKGMVEKCNERR